MLTLKTSSHQRGPLGSRQAAQSRAPQEAAAATQAPLPGSPRAVMGTTGQGTLKGCYACAPEAAATTAVHLRHPQWQSCRQNAEGLTLEITS